MTKLSAWFKDRPLWMQDAAQRIIQYGDITSDDVDEMVVFCKQEASGNLGFSSGTSPKPISNNEFKSISSDGPLRLKAIKNVVGINALFPRKPLEFGYQQLTIIYGGNGVGKSGYLRLLKHICGARAPGQLLGDVFATSAKDQSCKIDYTLDGINYELEWVPAKGVIGDLKGVAIYDTDCAYVYVDKEHEVSYEPPLLGMFRELVDVCGKVDQALRKEIDSKVSSLPMLPNEYAGTTAASWFKNIDINTSAEDVASNCAWSDNTELLNRLNQRLSEVDLQLKANSLRKNKTHLSRLIKLLAEIKKQLSDAAFEGFLKVKKEAETKRRAATEDADRIFANAPLNGISSESWSLLWEQARLFSEEVAYPTNKFPNTDAEARCVLCQQLLAEDAKERLRSFESFVKGTLELEASEAEQKVHRIFKELPELPNVEKLDEMLDLASVTDEAVRNDVGDYCSIIKNRREKFCIEDDLTKLPSLPIDDILESLSSFENTLEMQALAYEQDAQTNDRSELLKQKSEIEARKWLFEQKKSIENEIVRQKNIDHLEKARQLTNTKALTHKASSLSEDLVTEAFKTRFRDEISFLGAKRIRVGIEKVRATKGQVLHKLTLSNAKTAANTRDVLSEGEFRIVSIAAFLADVATKDYDVPIIFDDPISSLDQDYEERVAERFVRLAQSHQVIIFTHRLSFLFSLENAGEKQRVDFQVVSLQRESWGTGEPGNPPLPAQKPRNALNTLLNERLATARKVLEEKGRSDYDVLAKALCRDIRIIIERLIEKDLLADVVQRFRRQIKTMGKLKLVAKVTSEDCEFIDELMTKYSHYEHSQPEEAPIELPEPDELKEDLNRLKNWLDEFSSREVPA